jgi:hypothetical protein
MKNNYYKLRRACDIRQERNEKWEEIMTGLVIIVLFMGAFAICIVQLLQK